MWRRKRTSRRTLTQQYFNHFINKWQTKRLSRPCRFANPNVLKLDAQLFDSSHALTSRSTREKLLRKSNWRNMWTRDRRVLSATANTSARLISANPNKYSLNFAEFLLKSEQNTFRIIKLAVYSTAGIIITQSVLHRSCIIGFLSLLYVCV